VTKKRRRSAPKTQLQTQPKASRRLFLWLAAILALTFAAYLPSLDNGFTNWDDTHYVTANPLLAHPTVHALLTRPLLGNYHPLTMWSLALNYKLSGFRPGSYHWLNLLLHLANTALVFAFVWMLSGGRRWTTVATSLFFGIHPMHVESVAWIAERKDVLFAFFYLLGLITYLRYLAGKQLPWLGVTLAAFVLSAASKPAAVVFPVTLLAIDVYRRRGLRWPVLAEKIPFFAVSLVCGYLTLKAQILAEAIDSRWNPFERVLIASKATVLYIGKLFAPFHLSAIYPYPPASGNGLGADFYAAFAAVLVLIPVAVFLLRRNRPALFGLAFFFINIALVLQFLTVGGAVIAERYSYIPYIGLFFALAWCLDDRAGAAANPSPWKKVVAAIFLLLLPISLYQTWVRCDVWKDSESLWSDTIRKFPDAARAWNFKGVTLAEQSNWDSAYVYFDRAIRIMPNYSQALNNRAAMRIRRGDTNGAFADVNRAVALNSTYRDAYANRAIVYSMLGEREKSIADNRRAIELEPRNPSNPQIAADIGDVLRQLNRPQEAIPAYDQAIQATPDSDPRLGSYYLSRSMAWAVLGEKGKAAADAGEARRRGTPVDSLYLRGLGG
jgi:tetratricopeptide (TPR) repeat protein